MAVRDVAWSSHRSLTVRLAVCGIPLYPDVQEEQKNSEPLILETMIKAFSDTNFRAYLIKKSWDGHTNLVESQTCRSELKALLDLFWKVAQAVEKEHRHPHEDRPVPRIAWEQHGYECGILLHSGLPPLRPLKETDAATELLKFPREIRRHADSQGVLGFH